MRQEPAFSALDANYSGKKRKLGGSGVSAGLRAREGRKISNEKKSLSLNFVSSKNE